MRKICVIDWQSYPSQCDTLFSVYSMIRHYGFYPERMIRHYVIHPTNCSLYIIIIGQHAIGLLKSCLGILSRLVGVFPLGTISYTNKLAKIESRFSGKLNLFLQQSLSGGRGWSVSFRSCKNVIFMSISS